LAVPNLENQKIRINNKPVFYKRYFNYGIQTVGHLHFDLNNIDSYELIANHIQKMNYLEWTGLRHSVPLDLRTAYHNPDHTVLNPPFKIEKTITLSLSVKRLPSQITRENWSVNLISLTSHWKKLFLFPIQLPLSQMSRPFGSKYWTIYSTRIQSYINSGTLQMIYVLFANMNQKQCSISFMIALKLFNFLMERFRIILLIFDETADLYILI